MSLLNVSNLAKYFGNRCLFSGLDFDLAKGQRLAVVGRNGEGKTTLLRILAGELPPDEGSVHLARGASLGYLSQDLVESKNAVLDEVILSRKELWELRDKLRELEKRMSSPDVEDGILDQYGRAMARFESLGGYEIEHKAAAILTGLGLPRQAWDIPVSALSGGQKVRVSLAKLLLREPDVLILDEPTNHLDIAGVEWLEEYLQRYPGGVILVSHDRYFMDQLAHKVIEIADGKASLYRGNYSSYLEQKQAALRKQEQDYERQQEFVEKTRAFIQKWKANARRTGQAKSREKVLERLEMVEKPRKEKRTFKAGFDGVSRSGKEVLVLTGLTKSFPQKDLFRDFFCLILRGERVALVGENGCGKTTFLECIQGLRDHAGEVRWGPNVKVAYFSQDLDSLSDENTVLEEIRGLAGTPEEARDALGRFLFSGDDMEKKVRNLSGGERNRLSLLKLVLSKPNVLLLDEPTNHLDLPSKEALEKALLDFPGTVIFASHDRYFIDQIATRLFVFQNSEIRDFRGNYSAWKQTIARIGTEASTGGDAREGLETRTGPVTGTHPAGVGRIAGETPSGQAGCHRGQRARAGSAAEKKRREQDEADTELERNLAGLAELEDEIKTLEEREKQLAAVLSNPESYREARALPWKEWGETRARLKELYGYWEELQS
ncbi:MAG TPA: ATP-binding cassette domain-containing protein [Firmicutes bacterium]|nr:ATP-binding cassette domain-containing protein [Candidatus Fermentithermobacillaceae bacterium]